MARSSRRPRWLAAAASVCCRTVPIAPTRADARASSTANQVLSMAVLTSIGRWASPAGGIIAGMGHRLM